MRDVLAKQQADYGDRMPVVWRCGCKESGLGDRLKGIVAAWMLAMVLKRPFACEVFPSMVELEFGIEESLIDWRHRYQAYVARGPWDRVNQQAGGKPIWSNRAATAMNSNSATDYTKAIEVSQTTPAKIPLVMRFVTEVLGEDPAILLTEPFVGDGKEFTSDDATNVSHAFREMYAHAHFCATRAMFRPTQKMLELLDASLAPPPPLPPTSTPEMMGIGATTIAAANTPLFSGSKSAEPFVIGLHSRFGGKWKDRKRAKDQDVEKVVECAWNMTQAYTAHPSSNAGPEIVWVLTSDNVERLETVVGQFADKIGKATWDRQGIRLVAPKDVGIVEHVIKSVNGSDVEATKRLWLDWFLMTEVHTCSLIRSSFPRTACYTSSRRSATKGLTQQYVTNWDLGRYPRYRPVCNQWTLDQPER